MRSRKGFTLIELMVVVLIVAVLAALVVPLLLSRVEKARYSEGKAIASQIATAVRTYAVETETAVLAAPSLTVNLGFMSGELDAKWFAQTGMSVSGVSVDSGVGGTGTMNYIITLIPRDLTKLSRGNLVLTCAANVTTFTPLGM
jgi:prepilin-type N-terminal cleavage/methylation domain-containing protein